MFWILQTSNLVSLKSVFRTQIHHRSCLKSSPQKLIDSLNMGTLSYKSIQLTYSELLTLRGLALYEFYANSSPIFLILLFGSSLLGHQHFIFSHVTTHKHICNASILVTLSFDRSQLQYLRNNDSNLIWFTITCILWRSVSFFFFLFNCSTYSCNNRCFYFCQDSNTKPNKNYDILLNLRYRSFV